MSVSDLAASRRFYEAALGQSQADGAQHWWTDFSIRTGHPPTHHLHVAFGARTHDEIDAYWQRLVDAGYRSDGAPGLRPKYSPSYYGAFVLDPDGNSIELVHHNNSRTAGIDHLWLRTPTLDRTSRFYQLIAEHLGLRLVHQDRGTFRYQTGGGSFTFVDGKPRSGHTHLALTAPDRLSVDAFYSAALAAAYHPVAAPAKVSRRGRTRYAASVLDPDGHTIEAIVRRAD